MNDWDHASARTVDWVSGACFLARRSAWEEVGGFDRAYFMYLEDVDLCWRLGSAGWAVAYEPAAQVVHVQGVSADRHPYRMLLAHHVSMWRFARRATPAGPALGAAPGPARPGRPSRPHGGAPRPGWPTLTGPARAGARRKVTW